MDEYFLRAEEFLKSMADSAGDARAALAQNNWAGYEEAMSGKTSAFHHFLTTDHILEESHPDYLKDDRWLELWNDVQAAEQALAAQIEIYQSSLNQTLRKMRKTKVALGRYQSGHQEKTSFEDGV